MAFSDLNCCFIKWIFDYGDWKTRERRELIVLCFPMLGSCESIEAVYLVIHHTVTHDELSQKYSSTTCLIINWLSADHRVNHADFGKCRIDLCNLNPIHWPHEPCTFSTPYYPQSCSFLLVPSSSWTWWGHAMGVHSCQSPSLQAPELIRTRMKQ